MERRLAPHARSDGHDRKLRSSGRVGRRSFRSGLPDDPVAEWLSCGKARRASEERRALRGFAAEAVRGGSSPLTGSCDATYDCIASQISLVNPRLAQVITLDRNLLILIASFLSNPMPRAGVFDIKTEANLLIIKYVGRGERIRTSDPLVPNQVLYQAEPLPELAVGRTFTGRKAPG